MIMMACLLRFSNLFVLLAASITFIPQVSLSDDFTFSTLNHTSIILVGATGDLAQKYLWHAIFDLYRSVSVAGHTFSIYGGARESHVTGSTHLDNILKSEMKCRDDNCGTSGCNCNKLRAEFMTSCKYQQLTEDGDYEQLCGMLNLSTNETGRLFYLAVPSTVYGHISILINRHCRPHTNAWLRVVYEKPFGRDLHSAQRLADGIGAQLSNNEIYIVDHYLGKSTMNSILEFRNLNRQWLEPYWNKHWVDRVDVVSAETVDCCGRTRFYDQYGVIRDMLQNHLTEAVVLAAMDLSQNASKIAQLKNDFLGYIHPPTTEGCIIGQYETYEEHVRDDTKDELKHSSTPTFAAVLISILSSRWDGVPFVVVSGKQLPHRTAYIKVRFRDFQFQISSLGKADNEYEPEIIFHIQGGDMKTPAILVSRNFPEPTVPNGWQLEMTNMSVKYHVLVPVKQHGAYSTILHGVYDNKLDIGVPTSRLLSQWRVWTSLLQSVNTNSLRLVKYSADTAHRLDFRIVGNKLVRHEERMMDDKDFMNVYNAGISSHRVALASGYGLESLLGHSVIVGSMDSIITKLVQDIQDAAERAISKSGKFHLALPGGSSVLPLFDKLSFYSSSFPWQQTHLWLTDERCVPFNHSSSNFKSMADRLLNYVKVPYVNIHPVPVNVLECEDACQAYEKEIQTYIVDASIDFVVLGVGLDGHTASLFPDIESLDEAEKLVIKTVRGLDSSLDDYHRISLTYRAIQKAKEIAVLFHGQHKQNLLNELRHEEVDGKKYPIVRVAKIVRQMVWYIDTDLWKSNLGNSKT